MNKTERIAIKYLLIGIGVGLLKAFMITAVSSYLFELNGQNPNEENEVLFKIVEYLPNVIVGLFILIDSLKLLKNKIVISLLGFCIPVFGICFLLIENFLIEKIGYNDK